MAKKKKPTYYATCGQCAEPIDLHELNHAMEAGREYVHGCGRRLARPRPGGNVVHLKGSGNAEVPTSDPDDSNPSNTSTSE